MDQQQQRQDLSQYTLQPRPATNDPVAPNEIRISMGGKVSSYVTTATQMLQSQDPAHPFVVIKGLGPALVRAVTVAEILKRSMNVYQLTQIGSLLMTDHYIPLDPASRLSPLDLPRYVSFIEIKISLHPIEGAQPPSAAVPMPPAPARQPRQPRQPRPWQPRQNAVQPVAQQVVPAPVAAVAPAPAPAAPVAPAGRPPRPRVAQRQFFAAGPFLPHGGVPAAPLALPQQGLPVAAPAGRRPRRQRREGPQQPSGGLEQHGQFRGPAM
ncbi:putative ribonucleases P/MRP protein subunit RPP25 [Paratrimastix pyriformis]|uniref:Ribonucleases P/MRP protein subunit RPP25 n=1 Tax=Paratrimastix pyriformis TaxID=342808 RepID=A0ABQ8UJH5_9EUKA|nr:putative ribonucleases P/MRP protein subunit RPP25 [Paratrimastix pyriformis]